MDNIIFKSSEISPKISLRTIGTMKVKAKKSVKKLRETKQKAKEI